MLKKHYQGFKTEGKRYLEIQTKGIGEPTILMEYQTN